MSNSIYASVRRREYNARNALLGQVLSFLLPEKDDGTKKRVQMCTITGIKDTLIMHCHSVEWQVAVACEDGTETTVTCWLYIGGGNYKLFQPFFDGDHILMDDGAVKARITMWERERELSESNNQIV